jgi:hypothetical protein
MRSCEYGRIYGPHHDVDRRAFEIKMHIGACLWNWMNIEILI